MKTTGLLLSILLGLPASVWAQVPAGDAPPTLQAEMHRAPAELDQLLGPIALYPDALIALILPAATEPADIVLAARYLQDNRNDLSQVENRAWDDSVKSLAHYPEILRWMDANLEWTKQVGEAFTESPAEVMKSIQRLRAVARAAGTLVDTPQQQVISTADALRIVPTQPDVIYVPHYDPAVVYIDRPIFYPQPFLTFGVGLPVGSWLAYDCNWTQRTLWVGDRYRRWRGHDWHNPVVPVQPGYNGVSPVHQWRPSVRFGRAGVTAPLNQRPPVPPAYQPRSSYATGFQRDYPSPRVVAPETNRIASAPANVAPPLAKIAASPRTVVPEWQRNPDGRVRNVAPSIVNPTPSPVAPSLGMVARPLPVQPAMGYQRPYFPPHPVSQPIVAPPLQVVAPSLPVAPSVAAPPAVQAPAPPPARPGERGERNSRQGDRVQQY